MEDDPTQQAFELQASINQRLIEQLQDLLVRIASLEARDVVRQNALILPDRIHN